MDVFVRNQSLGERIPIPTIHRVPTVAIIPLKSFREGKKRLADAITAEQRAHLGMALALHVAEVAIAADLLPLFVTADPEVATWSATSGFPVLPESSEGLNGAARTGVNWAEQSGSRWVVLHSDLPLLEVDDLTTLLSRGDQVIAPSSDGGTSAISSEGPLGFEFGPLSFHRHLSRMTSPVVVTRTGFLLDVDSPDDLTAALGRSEDGWLAASLR